MSKYSEFKYFHIDRKLQKFIPWLARKLPRKLKYFVVIHGMVQVEPNNSPEYVRGYDLLKLWEPKVK